MKRIRLSTLMLLVTIVAMGFALVLKYRDASQATRRAAWLENQLAGHMHIVEILELSNASLMADVKRLELDKAAASASGK